MIRVFSFGKFSLSWRDDYIQRIKVLIPFEWTEIALKKNPNERPNELLQEEAKFLKDHREFFLLDAGGKEMSSKAFADWCFKENRTLVIGPAVGFHPDFFKTAKGSVSLSKLTFTHALAQTMLAESIYRSACMIKNHPFVK